MTEPNRAESLRERTRRAVQSELIDAAQELFALRGYEAVTVDEIAEAVGISRRSFFRYFGGKEALVLGKYDRQGESFAELLAARPADEEPWEALRRMFDGVVAYISDPELGARAAALDRVIQASDTLRAGYLERMERAQRLIVAELVRREGVSAGVGASGAAGVERASQSTLGHTAVVAAAFAALSAARRSAAPAGLSLGDALDMAMDAVAAVRRPHSGPVVMHHGARALSD
ncbi:MAG TPA: helix-turn-helix domain-containing protein [Microbacteriaceae bacterium]|jgi:AcrR family transcriptional regulator|nr:helix-turn-helix domain-containing protein [Microbacteriaceae bacterium]HQX36166.1 helix-turn-helix domain-containing protein [Microbacteriaceae bacterium]